MDNTRQTKGGGGSKNSVFGRTSFVNGPLLALGFYNIPTLRMLPPYESNVILFFIMSAKFSKLWMA